MAGDLLLVAKMPNQNFQAPPIPTKELLANTARFYNSKISRKLQECFETVTINITQEKSFFSLRPAQVDNDNKGKVEVPIPPS